ncbi:uncharacterized protein ACBT57_021629 isoform 1-T5 [Dama dama]
MNLPLSHPSLICKDPRDQREHPKTQALERLPFRSERPLGANGSDTTDPLPGPKTAAAGVGIASGRRPASARPACGPLDAPGPRPASHTLAAWLRPGPPGRGRRERKRKRWGRGGKGKGEGRGGDHCAHRQHEYLRARGSTRALSGRGDPTVFYQRLQNCEQEGVRCSMSVMLKDDAKCKG